MLNNLQLQHMQKAVLNKMLKVLHEALLSNLHKRSPPSRH